MVDLHNLPKTTTKKKKRIGRGYGSGVGGHTTIRGTKGFKARSTVPLTFDGSKIKKSWLKRLPFWRGKGRQKGQPSVIAINVSDLGKLFKKGEVVSFSSLIEKGLLRKGEVNKGVKILGKGKIETSLTVNFPCSQKAAEKIIKAGGKINNE